MEALLIFLGERFAARKMALFLGPDFEEAKR
jgi:hypothetical protein